MSWYSFLFTLGSILTYPSLYKNFYKLGLMKLISKIKKPYNKILKTLKKYPKWKDDSLKKLFNLIKKDLKGYKKMFMI